MTAFADANSVQDGTTLQTDVCIVGGGAAGITLASNLGTSELQVLILEAGSDRTTAESQRIYRADQSGLDYFDLDSVPVALFWRHNQPLGWLLS